MTRSMLWQRRVRKLPRLVKAVGAKLLRKGRKLLWRLRQIIINGIYGELLMGSPSISTLAWPWLATNNCRLKPECCGGRDV